MRPRTPARAAIRSSARPSPARTGAGATWTRLRSSHRANCGLREVRVHELHGHRSLADGRRAALRRPGANVPGREDARNARLEQAAAAGRLAREHEAVLVAGDDVAQPLGAGHRAEEEEEEREHEAVAVLERHALEAAVLTVELRDLAPVADGDAEALELADQVVRHRLGQVGAPVQQGDERTA